MHEDVFNLMRRVPLEHMDPTFRSRLKTPIPGGVVPLPPEGAQGGGGMPRFVLPANLKLVALYGYDAFNRRSIRVVVGWETFTTNYDGWREITEHRLDLATLTVQPIHQFVHGSELDEVVAYRRNNGGTWEDYYILHGGQDTAAKLVDVDGDVVESYEYDAYGKANVFVGTSTTRVSLSSKLYPFLWKGVRLDPEGSGLLYMRNRYYSTTTGRFLSSDPIGVWGDMGNMGNEYAYGWSTPLIVRDALGRQALVAWIGGALEGRGGDSTSVAMRDHQGDVGTHKLFRDVEGESSDEDIMDWVVSEHAAQTIWLDAWPMKSPCQRKIDPIVVLIGHSLGGAQGQRVTRKLRAMGIAVNFLVSLDAVGSRDGLWLVDQITGWNGSDLASPETHWVNCYNMTLADNFVDLIHPTLLVKNFIGGVLGWLGAGVDGGSKVAGAATGAGDRQGHEAGAVNYEHDVGHENASEYLRHALEVDPQLRSGLVDTGILR